MNIKDMLDNVIPPNNVAGRYKDFNNTHIIDSLKDDERLLLEEALIEKLHSDNDLLIVQTLHYLKSLKSLPVIYNYLNRVSNPVVKICVAVIIFEMNKDTDMIRVSMEAFSELEANKDAYFNYKIISAFGDLGKFRHKEINERIKKYTDDKDFLVSYHAKKAIENQPI